MRQPILAVSVLVSILAVCPAKGLDPCTAQNSTGGYLIYVDTIPGGLTDASQQMFADRLRFAVESNLQELQLKLQNDRSRQPDIPQVFVIPCDQKRRPHQKSDFTTAEIQSLDESRVVLELWGLVLNSGDGRGQVGYALISVSTQRIADPAVYTLDRGLGRNPAMVLRVFSKSPELQAYADIAVGTRLFQNHQFLLAAGYLCSGTVKLKKILTKPQGQTGPLFVAEQNALISGIIHLRHQALQSLGRSPSSDACPVELTQ